MADLRWWREATPLGELTITVGDLGVCKVERDGAIPAAGLEECDTEIQDQLHEYFVGERVAFTVPFDLRAVRGEASRAILTTLATSVPFGTTVGYGELAARAGHPGAARAVGQAMARNPLPLVIPCHRVIGSSGAIGGFGWGVDAKRWLLHHEGVQWV